MRQIDAIEWSAAHHANDFIVLFCHGLKIQKPSNVWFFILLGCATLLRKGNQGILQILIQIVRILTQNYRILITVLFIKYIS